MSCRVCCGCVVTGTMVLLLMPVLSILFVQTKNHLLRLGLAAEGGRRKPGNNMCVARPPGRVRR